MTVIWHSRCGWHPVESTPGIAGMVMGSRHGLFTPQARRLQPCIIWSPSSTDRSNIFAGIWRPFNISIQGWSVAWSYFLIASVHHAVLWLNE